MKRAAREVKEMFFGPSEGDPFEQFVPRVCSVVLALIPAIAYVVRGWYL